MRVSKIEVTKLFGVFDYAIPLNLSDRITIIHGPNGYGKTALLLMLQGVLGNQFAHLRRVIFQKFTVDLEDGRKVSITKSPVLKLEPDGEKLPPSLIYVLQEPNGISQEHIIESGTFRDIGVPLEVIDRHVPELERLGPETWFQRTTGRRLDLDDVCEQYAGMLPIRGLQKKPLPEWILNLFKEFDVRLIEAQRLLNVSESRRNRRPDSQFGFQPSVLSYSRELAASIQAIQAKYGTSSQLLDSTFPSRVIEKSFSAPINPEELKARFQELEQKRQRIINAGLLAVEHQYTPIYGPQQVIDKTTQSILTLYAEDVEKKLGVFSEMAEKIELFKELVNKRFRYKRLDLEAQSGFRLRTDTGGPLLPSDLSSGEQHELVLLYELLFRTAPNALILIDEPELSLHVAWQVEFLKDLGRIIKLSNFDVIIATHSPQIINDRWDLAVELKGP